MEIGNIIPHIEALVFASDKPLTSMEITELINNAFGFMEEKLTLEQIQTALDGIIEKYASEFYPFEVRESGGGWQFLTKKDYHKTVAQLNGDKFLKRLSSAALETLSIIAYKQPITKGEIESIRGVSSDYSIQKLLEKELIAISGRNEDMVGKPLIYTTSKTFMDYFGINSAADLPKLKEVFMESLAEPTLMHYAPEGAEGTPAGREGLTEDGEPIFSVSKENKPILSVSEQGELLEDATTPIDPKDTTATTSGDATGKHASAITRTAATAITRAANTDIEATPAAATAEAEESDEQADEGDASILDATGPDATTTHFIPPYADDDLAAESTEASGNEEETDREDKAQHEGEDKAQHEGEDKAQHEGEEAFGEADEEGDDEAAGFDAEKNTHNTASDESDEDKSSEDENESSEDKNESSEDEDKSSEDENESSEDKNESDESADPPAHR